MEYARETALQVIDANLDRLREGLRVLEDAARYHPGFEWLQDELKGFRHQAGELEAEVRRRFPSLERDFRRMEIDSGTGDIGPMKERRQSLPELVSANFKRCEEALRSLEEFSRLVPELADLSPRFELLRHRLYAREGEAIEAARILSTEGRGRERVRSALQRCPLMPIVDERVIERRGLKRVLEELSRAAGAGLGIVQVRAKGASTRDFLLWSRAIAELGRKKGFMVVVNDRVDVAVAAGASGVHLGQEDLPMGEARRIAGRGMVVGLSTHSLKEARQAEEMGADYIGFGAVFPTESKAGTVRNSPQSLREVCAAVSLPVVAIGGVNLANMDQVREAGAAGFAAISLILEEAIDRAVAAVVERWRSENGDSPAEE